ncbi:class I SAM-dependent methyltransferase [Streptomyces chrestomyceticus]|uniref:class I SAM-dependent methyltransferase n=1 Tax=Streptomyces chrestomyceticus TaxID=68185 RepID=UPI0036BA5974
MTTNGEATTSGEADAGAAAARQRTAARKPTVARERTLAREQTVARERTVAQERTAGRPPGVQPYYARSAEALAERYESLRFETVHEHFLPLLPAAPAHVADIGAGTGRDAAALAALGHEVTAVEPVPELRRVARRLHPSPAIRWLADSLPDLPRLDGAAGTFDAILLSAVWMHLDAPDRPAAMRRLHTLLAPGGRLLISLRHGPPPEDRRMYDIPAPETVALATHHGLRPLQQTTATDHLGRDTVHWSSLAFEKERA